MPSTKTLKLDFVNMIQRREIIELDIIQVRIELHDLRFLDEVAEQPINRVMTVAVMGEFLNVVHRTQAGYRLVLNGCLL